MSEPDPKDMAWFWAHDIGLHRRIHAAIVRNVSDRSEQSATYKDVADAVDDALAQLIERGMESQSKHGGDTSGG